MTLGDYLSKTRFFLRDPQGIAYTTQNLTDCINQARSDIVSDTWVTRALTNTIFTNQNQTLYNFQTVLSAVQGAGYQAQQIIGIANIAVYWSATLKPTLDYMEWGDLNAWFGSFTGFTFIPSIWGMYDLQSFYLYPIPNGSYQLEIDAIYLPNYLVNTTDTDLLPPTIADFILVPYKAASIAKQNQQDVAMSTYWENKYAVELEKRMSQFPVFRIPSRYGNDPRRP